MGGCFYLCRVGQPFSGQPFLGDAGRPFRPQADAAPGQLRDSVFLSADGFFSQYLLADRLQDHIGAFYRHGESGPDPSGKYRSQRTSRICAGCAQHCRLERQYDRLSAGRDHCRKMGIYGGFHVLFIPLRLQRPSYPAGRP